VAVLILKNIPSEGPGTIRSYLDSASRAYRIVDLQSEAFPDASGFGALVMLGGPMSVNDTAEYPYLGREIELAAGFMKTGRTVFGICLGAQIMAKALGSRVYPGPEKEIGWHELQLVDAGLSDPLMLRLAADPLTGGPAERFQVFHWHGETFDIPAGAERLARSARYENQAFRYRNSYAFQFHIEVTKEVIYDWLKEEPVDQERLRRETESFHEVCGRRATNFYEAMFKNAGGDI